MQKYLKVMSLSAEYVGLKPSPAVQLHWFPGKKDASAHYKREEKGCVDTFRLRERGEYVRPQLVPSPPHRIPAFRTHNLGMSGTTLTVDGQKEVHILLYARRIILSADFCWPLVENKKYGCVGRGMSSVSVVRNSGVRFLGVHNVLLLG